MNDNQPLEMPSTETELSPREGKPNRFWQVFWLLFLVVSLAYAWYSFYAPSNRIAWAGSFAIAQQQAAEEEKPMILFFTGKWCSPCQIMRRQVWADEQVTSRVNAEFISVAIEVGNSNASELLSRYRIGATPNTIITDSQGNVLQRRQGGMGKSEFLEMLESWDLPSVEGS